MTFSLASGAFPNGAAMPKRFAQEGENQSPPLFWQGAPENTQSFALIVEDPDAPSGTRRHWAIYNIDAAANHLPEGVSAGDFSQALNDAGTPFTMDRSLPKAMVRTTIIFAWRRWMLPRCRCRITPLLLSSGGLPSRTFSRKRSSSVSTRRPDARRDRG